MENRNNPIVSICCITYNHENFIRDTIEGFLIQKTTFPFEIIIHDDASTDGTVEIVKEYSEKQPELFVTIYQKENQHSKGVKPFINFVVPKAKGKYIAVCEGDDYWTDPLKLQKQVDFLEADREQLYGAVATDFDLLNSEKHEITHGAFSKTLKTSCSIDLHFFLKQNINYRTLTVLFRRESFRKIENEFLLLTNSFFGDWNLWVLLHTQGMFYYINDVTGVYRKNRGSVTNTVFKKKAADRWKESLRIRRKLLNILDLEYHGYLLDDWVDYYNIAIAYGSNNILKFFRYLLIAFIKKPIPTFNKTIKYMASMIFIKIKSLNLLYNGRYK